MSEFSPYMKSVISKYLAVTFDNSEDDVIIQKVIQQSRENIISSVAIIIESGDLDEYLEGGASIASIVRGVASELANDVVQSVAPRLHPSNLEGYLLSLNSRVYSKTSAKAKSKKKKSDKFLEKTKAGSLLNYNNRYQSIFSLQNLIETLMRKNVLEDMGTGGALVNRSGRFFSSVRLERLTVSPKGEQVSLYYSYMYYPYQVFEPGIPSKHPAKSSLATTARSPRRLISTNLLDAARKILSDRYRLKIIQTGGIQ